ncbi:MAG: hypothetical protein ACI9U2_002535, partial [Bradymonadia bacterium]
MREEIQLVGEEMRKRRRPLGLPACGASVARAALGVEPAQPVDDRAITQKEHSA